MIRIGIDVHKITCVATIRNSLGRKPEQTSPANNGHDIGQFATHAGKRYGCGRIRAVCKSAVNYRMRLHDKSERHGIGALLAHPAKTKVWAKQSSRTTSGIQRYWRTY